MAFESVSGMEVDPAFRITVDPERYEGVPCIGDKLRPIARILESLASGMSLEPLARDDLDLTLPNIQCALAVAAWVMRDPAIHWSELHLPEMIAFHAELQAWQSLSDTAPDLVDSVESE